MVTSTLSGRKVINMDLFTDAYRVTGTAEVGAGGIHSEVGDPSSDFLSLHDAYVSRIYEPGEIVASFTQVAFRKDNIHFIVLQDRRDGVPMGTQHAASIYLRGNPHSVFLTVPSFEISGEVFHPGKPEPKDIVLRTIGHFLPVFVAKASAAAIPDITYSGDLILVHKERVGIVCFRQK